MSRSTRVHHYPFTLRTVAMTGNTMCQDVAQFYVVPPKKAISIEYCLLRFKATFDSAVPVDERVISYIGVGNERPQFIDELPTRWRKFDINVAADGDRKVDITLNLTPLLEKTHVEYRDDFNDDPATALTLITIGAHIGNRNRSQVATIELCKADVLYTTEGIR